MRRHRWAGKVVSRLKVVLSSRAADDLKQISGFIACDNPVRAVSFVGELREVALRLADIPLGYPLVLVTKCTVSADDHGKGTGYCTLPYPTVCSSIASSAPVRIMTAR